MSETSLVPPDVRKDSLTERVGPVLLIVTPLLAAMVGAMNMLGRVSDFSSGSWYAVGTVFVLILLGTLFGGLLCSWVLYLVRLRSNLLLRFVFALAAAGIAYSGVIHLPNHLVVRENDFPGVVLPEGWHLGR